jgi:hypothetical protein
MFSFEDQKIMADFHAHRRQIGHKSALTNQPPRKGMFGYMYSLVKNPIKSSVVLPRKTLPLFKRLLRNPN